MSVSKMFISAWQELSNKMSQVLSEILYFNDSTELLVSLQLMSALNSSLNENNLNKIELPFKTTILW